MKNKHIKMFLLDQLSIIILFLLAPLFFIFYMPDITWLYYYFLSIFLLLCYLVYKLYTTWNLYELFCNENKKIEEFLLYSPKSREEYHYKKLISELYHCYNEKIIHMEDEKQQNKLIIYRWVHQLKSNFIEKNIFPKLHVDENLIVYSDYKWLSFVIYQLLTNAIKYSDNGKSVFIKAYNEDKKIILSIEYEGCGITKEDIPRIFELFFTGENGRLYGESSGLGLYMVKQILDYLGHSIKVESDIKIGSKFKIIFN